MGLFQSDFKENPDILQTEQSDIKEYRLKFPSLRSVLEYERCLSMDQKAFEEKYGEWLK